MKYCSEKQELIQEYIDNRLAAEARTELERHLEECSACRAYTDKLKLLAGDIKDLGEAFPNRVTLPVPEYQRSSRWFTSPRAVYATLSLVLIVGVIYYRIDRDSFSMKEHMIDAPLFPPAAVTVDNQPATPEIAEPEPVIPAKQKSDKLTDAIPGEKPQLVMPEPVSQPSAPIPERSMNLDIKSTVREEADEFKAASSPAGPEKELIPGRVMDKRESSGSLNEIKTSAEATAPASYSAPRSNLERTEQKKSRALRDAEVGSGLYNYARMDAAVSDSFIINGQAAAISYLPDNGGRRMRLSQGGKVLFEDTLSESDRVDFIPASGGDAARIRVEREGLAPQDYSYDPESSSFLPAETK